MNGEMSNNQESYNLADYQSVPKLDVYTVSFHIILIAYLSPFIPIKFFINFVDGT